MPRSRLSDRDISGAFRELTTAVGQLASHVGVTNRHLGLSDAQELEVQRIQLSNPGLLSQEVSAQPESDGSAASEILRLTATYPRELGGGAGRSTARARSEAQTLALSAAGSGSQVLVSQWGLPITVAGVPVTEENAHRLGLGSTLPPMVVDVTDDDSDVDAGGYDQEPDEEDEDQDYGSAPATGDVDAEVARLQESYGSAIAGLRTGARRHTGATGRFTSRNPLRGPAPSRSGGAG
jgi:hypothetical protein